MKNQLITKKLDELIELAKSSDEGHVASILLAVVGARLGGEEKLISDAVAKCVEEVLIPKIQGKIHSAVIRQN